MMDNYFQALNKSSAYYMFILEVKDQNKVKVIFQR